MFTNVSVFVVVVVDNMTKIDALGHLTAAGALRSLLMKTPSETHTLLAQHVPSDAQPEVKIAIAASRRP
jgi:hypothetical protein